MNTNQLIFRDTDFLTSDGDRIVIAMQRLCRVSGASGIFFLGGGDLGWGLFMRLYTVCYILKVHSSFNTQAAWYVCNKRLYN
jgi:hypothetical protein